MVNKEIKCPCRSCLEREIGCHSDCPKYQAYTKEVELYRKHERQEKMKDIFADISLTTNKYGFSRR